MNILKKCNNCKKWFAMEMHEKTVVKKEKIQIFERLFKHNPKGGVEPVVDHFTPGERVYYNIRYLCKYCGAEETRCVSQDIKK